MDPERRLAEALRAQAAGGAWPGPAVSRPAAEQAAAPRPVVAGALRRQVLVALVTALVVGVLLGVALALVSVLVPGLLPPLG